MIDCIQGKICLENFSFEIFLIIYEHLESYIYTKHLCQLKKNITVDGLKPSKSIIIKCKIMLLSFRFYLMIFYFLFLLLFFMTSAFLPP